MADPITIFTASAIANLAFQEFIKSGAGEVAKKFSAGAIAKINDLRKMIVHKLQGKDEKLDTALTSAEKGDLKAIATVGKYLESAMQDEAFAQAVQSLAQQIQQDIDIQQGTGGEVWNVIGKAEKNEFIDNKAPIIKDSSGNVTINYGMPPQ
jgi:Skp family chaperone for outer membrane proteins